MLLIPYFIWYSPDVEVTKTQTRRKVPKEHNLSTHYYCALIKPLGFGLMFFVFEPFFGPYLSLCYILEMTQGLSPKHPKPFHHLGLDWCKFVKEV